MGVNLMVCMQFHDLHDHTLMVVLFSAPVTANFQNWTLRNRKYIVERVVKSVNICIKDLYASINNFELFSISTNM